MDLDLVVWGWILIRLDLTELDCMGLDRTGSDWIGLGYAVVLPPVVHCLCGGFDGFAVPSGIMA